MKKKQFMSKLAALTMAAAMGLTAVPATALNVMASTAVTSTTKDDEAAAFPPTATVEGWLDTLTATQASDKLKTITTDVVKSTITTELTKLDGAGTISVDGVTEDPTKKQDKSDANSFAYCTFNITLTNSADSKTRTYTAVLTADTLTEAETKGILPSYLQKKISDTTFTKGSAAASQLTDAVKDAVKSFNDKYKTAVETGTVGFDGKGAYTISVKTPTDTPDVTGTLNFSDYKDSQVSVENKTNGTTSGRKTLKDAVLSMNINISASPYYNSTTKTYDTDKIASDVTTALSHGFTAQNVSVTDADNWSFEAYDSTGTYKVTIGTGADLETDNSALKTALDNYFASNEIKTAKNKTLRNYDIAALVNADDAVTAAKKTYTIDGDGNALGSDGSGKLTIKNGSTTYTYAFTADVKVSEETEAEANKKALATVNATTYPEYRLDGTVKYDKAPAVSHDGSLLSKKLLSDLKDAGYNTAGQSLGTATGEAADKTTNGEYKAVINPNNDVVDVSLAYSSDQKLQDTEKALEKFLAKGSTKASNSTAYTEHKAATGVKLDDVFTPHDEYSFKTTSALSQKVQSKKAVKATSAADAADIVKAAIDEQLKASGVADNGVGVTVKAVNTAAAKADNKYDVTKAAEDATADVEGTIKLLVTASIKNDFYGWSNGTKKDTAKTVSYSYLMNIDTNKLKENKAKTISLADKTVLLSGGYYTTKKSDYQPDENEVTYVEITPVIDPEDANTAVTYKVYDSDNSLVTDEVQISDTNAVYKKGSDTAVKAGTNALGLMIKKTGTYTIKAAAGDAEATMKLTVKKNFDDVSATAYYKNAVVWAYGNGVTSGVTQDLFGVNTDVTRAQYVTWLYRYAVSQDSNVAVKDADVKSVFSDVAATAYYAKAVQWAKETGVTAGTTDTTFAPNATITRAEAVTMLWRAYGKPSAGIGSENEKTVKFTDVPANAYYTTAVTWAVGKEITNGTSTTTFSPNKSCSRAEGITFIYNLYE